MIEQQKTPARNQEVEVDTPKEDSVKDQAEKSMPFIVSFGTYLIIAAVALIVAVVWIALNR